MEFSDRNRWVLAEAIKALMETEHLDRITVTDIVKKCGTTRQTFYRYFKDKYDLVNWYFDQIVQKTINQMGVSLTLREGLVKKFQLMDVDRAFFISALTSKDYNNLMDYDYQCILEFYKRIARSNGGVSDEIDFLIEFYCHGSMDMTASWVRGGMTFQPEEMADFLIDAMPEKLHDYLSNLSKLSE